jgi:hypothetical protein
LGNGAGSVTFQLHLQKWGTSVDQIERFYARNLPLSREMAINLQSFISEA